MSKNIEPNLGLVNGQQLAALIPCTVRTLRDWRLKRGLPFVKITSKVIRYELAEVQAWLKQHRNARVS